MAEHRAGVAKAEIVELVAVDVGDGGAFGAVDQDRERRRPVAHPVHRHAAEETGDAVAELCLGSRPRLAEGGRFRLAQFGDTGDVDAADGILGTVRCLHENPYVSRGTLPMALQNCNWPQRGGRWGRQ
jgi:hypothetical protein